MGIIRLIMVLYLVYYLAQCSNLVVSLTPARNTSSCFGDNIIYTCEVRGQGHGILQWTLTTFQDVSGHSVTYDELSSEGASQFAFFKEIIVSLDSNYLDQQNVYILQSTINITMTERIAGSLISCNYQQQRYLWAFAGSYL